MVSVAAAASLTAFADTLTSKRMNVSGIADCIGGVRYPDRAFSISNVAPDRNVVIAGAPLNIEGAYVYDSSAKVLGHEIGHLMGGHHHLANHVEREIRGTDADGCTIMASPCGMAGSFKFSTANGAIVRGHANTYARP